MRQGPLAGRYPAVAAMVLFALVPYLALSAALEPLTPIIAKDLHASLQTMSLGSGLANAAYAIGTVLAVQFAQHLPQRRMLVVYAALLLTGSVLAASAQSSGMYIAGRVLQGLCTSLLLIAAVPPLAIGYPASKLRITAMIMNLCIFGAVALGPTLGGLQANSGGWRPLFWIVAAIAACALILSLLTFDDAPPADPDSPRDLPAHRARGRRLRRRVLRRLSAPHPPFRRPDDDRAAARGARADRHARRLRVPREAPAAHDPHDAHEHDARRRSHRRALRGSRVGLGDRPHRSRAAPALRPASRRSPLPAGGRGSGDHGDPSRRRLQAPLDPLPAAGGDGLPRSRDRGLRRADATERNAHADRLGSHRHRPRRDGRARALRRRLLAAVGQSPARVRDRRAAARGRRVHDRADLRPLRR